MPRALLLCLPAALAFLLPASCRRPAGEWEGFQNEQYRRLYVDPLDDFFARETRGGAEVYAAQRPGALSGTVFPKDKTARTRRVFVVGGSVALLFDERVLESVLAQVLPGTRLELVDCGVSAYDSLRDLLTVEEVLRYDPDLVIVMSGVNEGILAGPDAPSRLRLAGLALRGLLKLSPRKALRLARARAGDGYDPVATFAANARAMIRAAKARKVPILMCALPWNVRDMPPGGSLPLDDEGFFEGWFRFEQGDYRGAAEAFERELPAAHGRPGGPAAFVHYCLGRSLDALGEKARARQQYLEALDHQSPPILRVNEALRRVCAEEGVPLADLEAAFFDAAPDRMPGFDLFEDDMHWDRSMDGAVAAVMAGALAGSPLTASWGWSRGWLDSQRARLLHPRLPPVGGKAWVVFAVRAWDSAFYRSDRLSEKLVALMELVHRSRPGLLAEARGLREWVRARLAPNVWDPRIAARLDGWWPAMLGHAGEAQLRRGDPAAALASLDAAVQGLPPDKEGARAQLRLRGAVALARLGRGDEARRRLDELRPFERAFPEVRWYRDRLDRIRPAPKSPPAAKPSLDEGELALEERILRPAELVRRLAASGRKGEARARVRLLCARGPEALPAREWLDVAEAAGDEGAARLALENAARLNAGGRERADLAAALSRLGDRAAALRAAAPLAGDGDAALAAQAWLELSRLALSRGDKALARRFLDRASTAQASGEERLEVAQAYLGAGDAGRAAAVAAGTGGLPAARWLGLAGGPVPRELALAALDKAAASQPTPAQLLDCAWRYVRLGEHARAAALAVRMHAEKLVPDEKSWLDLAGSLVEAPQARLDAKGWADLSRALLERGQGELARRAQGRAPARDRH